MDTRRRNMLAASDMRSASLVVRRAYVFELKRALCSRSLTALAVMGCGLLIGRGARAQQPPAAPPAEAAPDTPREPTPAPPADSPQPSAPKPTDPTPAQAPAAQPDAPPVPPA